ncbi:MAG: 16S rRNA (guanine(966)-N(2))-methyltransferase RsmD [Williamsia herbipolensis]|nr:16S rRNA (guanine(966)-N(2))-methyltransferase RsmD [Williamsia herbipolensis]
MRIIAGVAGGRLVTAPPAGTRPTTDRVRESLFAMLETRMDLDGVRVLDLYAGSGALALEAVSRGAGHATLVDSDAKAVAVIRANARIVGAGPDVVTVVRRRADAFLQAAAGDPFDLVFCDPPYDLPAEVVDGHAARLVENGWLAPRATVVVERSARSPATTWPDGLYGDGDRRYGDTRVEFALLA